MEGIGLKWDIAADTEAVGQSGGFANIPLLCVLLERGKPVLGSASEMAGTPGSLLENQMVYKKE